MSRAERVESLLKQEIATIIATKIDDGRIGFISITGVEISPDFHYAKVFFSILGSDEELKKTRKGLKSAAGCIKGELSKVIRMQTIPDLRFYYDDSLKRGTELVQKINRLKDS